VPLNVNDDDQLIMINQNITNGDSDGEAGYGVDSHYKL